MSDPIEDDLRAAFIKVGFGDSNLSTVDSAAHTAIRRVLSRRGIGGYRFTFVWPVVRIVLRPGEQDEETLTFDVRELSSET